MDDRTWLAGRLDADLLAQGHSAAEVGAAAIRAAEIGLHGAVVAPTHVSLVPGALAVTAAVGYPTGRHHSLIKASEARLAVEFGASEIWLALDHTVADTNALLAEIVAVRQAVPPPVRLHVIAGGPETVTAAATAGADGVVMGAHDDVARSRETGTGLEVIVRAELGADAGVDKLAAGATRLALTRPETLLAELSR